jgi:hypothetical protein
MDDEIAAGQFAWLRPGKHGRRYSRFANMFA